MRAACENCGKLGEMEPGKPFVCAVCGHYHDPRVVGSRIAAEKNAADRKAEAERMARGFRPKPTICPPRPSPPRPSPPRSPPPAIRRIEHGSRVGSCVGGCISAFVKLGIGIFVLGMIIGSCLSSKPAKNVSPPCAKCGGTGIVKSLLRCSLCNGRKTHPIRVSEIDRRTGRPKLVTRRTTCPACGGTGGTNIDVVCPKCNGTKVLSKGGR